MNRRGFLKGMGAAAVAGAAGGAKADWRKGTDYTDPMDDKVYRKFHNTSTDGSADLDYNPDVESLKFQLRQNGGMFLPKFAHPTGRLRVDNGPAIPVSFAVYANSKNVVGLYAGDQLTGPDTTRLENYILNAKNRILIDITDLTRTDQKIISFNIQQVKENVNQGLSEEQHSCPHCGGEMVSEELMNEKKDACYYKVKSRYKVWPSAYASGALVKCRKKGASNWGTGGKKNESSILEGIERADENLHQWFKEKWVRFGPDGKIRGDCARGDDSEGKPKCLPQSKAHSLGKKGRASAASRKRREDPNPERSGKAINVNTKKKANEEVLDEKWSQKYKDSINCSNPKGFSQKAHCAGKKK